MQHYRSVLLHLTSRQYARGRFVSVSGDQHLHSATHESSLASISYEVLDDSLQRILAAVSLSPAPRPQYSTVGRPIGGTGEISTHTTKQEPNNNYIEMHI